MATRHRVIVLVVLAFALGGLCVHYGATSDENWPHPSGDQLAEEPGDWDGERVLLFGTVREVDGDEKRLVVEVEDDAGDVARVVEVRGTTAAVEPGGLVQVYGELTERGTVQHADRVVVVHASPASQWFKLGASGVGGLIVSGAFLRYWRIDWRRLRFEKRGGRGG